MDLLSAIIIIGLVSAVTGTRRWVLRWWHRKKFCESKRSLCRALVAAGFYDFKKYLYFKEDAPPGHELLYNKGVIEFGRSGMSKQDRERILEVVDEYLYCSTDYTYDRKEVAGIPIRPENYSLICQKVESTKIITRIYLGDEKDSFSRL